ncbi:MAG: preprotein translocase subunit YajC [Alphaproteobacteria bacterium]
MLFVSVAHAADVAGPAAAAAPQGSILGSFLPLILIFVVFYFLLIRPQQKKVKEHQGMITSLSRGDKVVTGGGIVGTVTKVNSDTEVTVEIAEGTKVTVMRSMIAARLESDGSVSGDPQGVLGEDKANDKKAA